jgi:hypothetical protein
MPAALARHFDRARVTAAPTHINKKGGLLLQTAFDMAQLSIKP